MYLSYSGFKTYKAESEADSGCAYAYWNSYINHTETDTPDDRLGSIYGIVVGRLFEIFYNDKIWRRPEPQACLMKLVEPVLEETLKKEVAPGKFGKKAGVLLWKGDEGSTRRAYENREEILADVRDAVSLGFRVIRQERLLGPRADAEVKLDADIGGHRIGGRADFIIHRTKPQDDEVILDGKGGRDFGKYVDRTQLVWYSMLFRHHYKRLPKKVGFLYWRAETVAEAVDWQEVTDEDCDALLEKVLATIADIEQRTKQLGAEPTFEAARSVFLPVVPPNRNSCGFCDYGTEAICPDGAKFKEAEAKKAARRKRKV